MPARPLHPKQATRHIELDVSAPSKTLEVCIRPELSISLFFDAKLARVDVEGGSGSAGWSWQRHP